jgi:hypothetical protein
VDRHRRPPPRIDGRRKGEVGQREKSAAVDKVETVQMVFADGEPRLRPAVADREELDPDKPGKAVLPEKAFYHFGRRCFHERLPASWVLHCILRPFRRVSTKTLLFFFKQDLLKG